MVARSVDIDQRMEAQERLIQEQQKTIDELKMVLMNDAHEIGREYLENSRRQGRSFFFRRTQSERRQN